MIARYIKLATGQRARIQHRPFAIIGTKPAQVNDSARIAADGRTSVVSVTLQRAQDGSLWLIENV